MTEPADVVTGQLAGTGTAGLLVKEEPTEVLPPLPSIAEPTIVARTKSVPSTVPTIAASVIPAPAPVRHEVMIPAPPVPPMPPVAGVGSPGEPGKSRRVPIIVSAVVAVLAIAAGVLALLLSGSDEPEQATVLLRDARDKTTVVMRRANAAENVGQLNVVGGLADRGSDDLGAIQDQLEAFEDKKIGGPAAVEVQAQKRYLDRLTSLRRVDRDQLARWTGIKDRVIQASRDLRDAGAPVDALKLESPVPLTIAVADLSKTTNEINSLVTSAQKRLRRYRVRLADWRAVQKRAGQSVRDYQSTVEGILGAYATARDKTDRFVDSADTRNNMDIARDSLLVQTSAREDLIARLGGIPVPRGVGGTHAEIVKVIQDSIEALGYASMATYEYEDPTTPVGLTHQSSWRTFQSQSEIVGNRREGVVARWRLAVGSAEKAAKDAARTDPPSAPTV